MNSNILKVNSHESSSLRNLLREVEARNDVLKKELKQLNTSRISLEESCRLQEREKNETEDQLEEVKLLFELKIEEMRKEWKVNRKELEQSLKEKEVLCQQVHSFSREERMTDCALRSQAFLIERLDYAQKELADLQEGLSKVQLERDAALVSLAADVAEKSSPCGGTDEASESAEKGLNKESDNGVESENSETNEGRSTVEFKKSYRLRPVTSSSAFRDFLLSVIAEE